MVDSNIQRENILPSERAKAYKMKLDAIKRQGARTDLTSPQVAAKFRSDDKVAEGANISGDTVRRYIRLNELTPELQQMVDDKKIAMNNFVFTPCNEVAVNLSNGFKKFIFVHAAGYSARRYPHRKGLWSLRIRRLGLGGPDSAWDYHHHPGFLGGGTPGCGALAQAHSRGWPNGAGL